MPIKFRFSWIPFLAAAIVIVIGISLGNWQTRRALEKEAVEAALTAREAAAPLVLDSSSVSADTVEFRRVVAKGEFLPDWQVYLDNRPHRGAAGFYVLTPFKIAGSNIYVLVMRGWGQRDVADRTKLPVTSMPQGHIEIAGIAMRGTGQVLQLGRAEPLRPGAIVQNATIADFESATGLRFLPIVIEQLNDTEDGLARDWPRPSTGIEKHRGYAFQWYALAATAFVFFLATGFSRGKK